ncbi:MAG: hypothetical protein WBP81_06215 [Solirubrobacteraceae bacterium]
MAQSPAAESFCAFCCKHIDARGDGDVGEAIIAQLPEGRVRLGYKRRYARPF